MANRLLKWLVRRNLRLRKQHKLPDEWYWADLMLIKQGIFYDGI